MKDQALELDKNELRIERAARNITEERVKLVDHIESLYTQAQNLSGRLTQVAANVSRLDATTPIPGFVPVTLNDSAPLMWVSKSRGISKQKKNRAGRTRYRRSSPWGKRVQRSRPLTELEDDASVNITATDTSRFMTRVLESGLISPELGLVMEQTGSYMEYSGYIYIPIIYHMSHLIPASLVGRGKSCNITANREHQELIIQLLKEKVGTLIPQGLAIRKRRFIETMLLGGVVAWNRASIWSLQDNVASLDNQIAEMKNHNQIVVSSINTLVDNQHAIHHAVDRQARILREFMEKTSCEEIVTNYFREIYSTWLSLAPNDFARVVDSALSGKITPDLLPATDVLSVLLKHPAMVSTAYSRDMTLLYELGKFSLHQVNYDPYPMVSGVMIFPRILIDRSAALMRIHTTLHTQTKIHE